jgi:spore germination protein YaaH
MIRQLVPRIRKVLLTILYVAAFVIAAFLIYETVQLARQRPDIPVIAEFVPSEPPPEPERAADNDTTFLSPGSESARTSAPTPLAVSTSRGTVLTTTSSIAHPKTGRHIAAWFPPSFSGGARESFEANMDVLDEISPFWYSPDASGRLYGNRDEELVRIAHENNVLVLPSIHNIGSFEVVIEMLSDPYIRARHVQNIVDEVLAQNYDGIDIDYEALPESMRPAFSAFIVELAEALHAHDKLLSVAVHAKDCDYCGMGGFQDWNVIGQHADRLRIMTYDYHWRGGGPGPVAPLYWVESVAEYARATVDPSKVFIGVPFYGYDWPAQGSARGLPWADIEDLIDSEGLTVNLMQRDAQGRVDESWFRYDTGEGTREVWFMTDDGLESKIDLVQRLDLAGIAIWRIGYEKPEYWQVIRNELSQDPVLIQRAIHPLLPEH